MRGNPPEVTPDVPDTLVAGATAPFALNRRVWSCGPCAVRSIQLTTESPEAKLTTSTRPAGLPPSTRIFVPNVLPASEDISRFTCGFSFGAVNHATATFFPFDEIA